jgi:CHAD domain-containing protein
MLALVPPAEKRPRGAGSARRELPRPTALLRAYVRALERRLPGAVAGEPEAVHQLRVACRRLRIALVVLPEDPGAGRARRIRRALRALARTAAPSRDLDVLLEGLQRAAGPATDPAAVLLRRLRQAQRRDRRRLGGALLDLDLARLRRDLRALLASPTCSHELATARAEALAGARRALAEHRLAAVGRRLDGEALHAVRRALRGTRYALELQAAEDASLPALRDQQARLGRIHDAWVLAGWLAKQAAGAQAAGRAELAAAAARLRRRVLAQARAERHAWLESDSLRQLRSWAEAAARQPS